MLFAEISDAVWLAVIVLAGTIVKEIFDRQRANDAAAKVAAVAATASEIATVAARKAEEVKTVLQATTASVASKVQKATEAVEAVKDALVETTEAAVTKAEEAAVVRAQTLRVVNIVHGLVNNEMHLALSAAATLARRVANMTGHATDAALATEAETKLREHDARQTRVDAQQTNGGRP